MRAGHDEFEAAFRARILAERTAELARSATPDSAAGDRVLLCQVGNDVVAIPLSRVAGVGPLPPAGLLPGAAAPVLGLVRAGGRFAAAVDLGLALGLGGSADAQSAFVLLRREPRAGLAVSRVLGLATVAGGEEAPSQGPVVRRLRVEAPEMDGGGGLAGLLDVEILLAPLLKPSSAIGA